MAYASGGDSTAGTGGTAGSHSTAGSHGAVESLSDMSVSRSAVAMLRLKALAGVPYARAALDDLSARFGLPTAPPGPVNAQLARAAQFEDRYRSVDELIGTAPTGTILEVGAGYSFRSLDYTARVPLRYLDTDLAQVVGLKRQLAGRLRAAGAMGGPPPGTVDFRELDVAAPGGWPEIAASVDPGDVTVVSEGLLMYLPAGPKAELCGRIRDLLWAHGGVWVCGDVYIRVGAAARVPATAEERSFNDRHQMWENRFASFPEAEGFFRDNGLQVVARAGRARSLVSIDLLRERGVIGAGETSAIGNDRQTWALAPQR